MRKIALYLIALCLLSSCERKVDHSIKYDGGNTVNIVLLEELSLNPTSESDLPITFSSDNEMVVTVSSNGVIRGKNVGEANITISNTIDEIVVKVVVSLYEEPTTNFYISENEIRNIYGEPNFTKESGDTTAYIYGSGNDWYSYAVWKMDLFFINDEYREASLYIRSDVELRLDEFLNKNYFYQYSNTDTISEQIYHIYLNKENPEDASVLLGKINNAGQYDDICILYTPFEYEGRKRL